MNTSRETQVRGPARRFTAKYAGRCTVCAKEHIQPGDQIVMILGGYAALACYERREKVHEASGRIARAMLEKERIALGTCGLPKGCQGTGSRHLFYRRALELGHCTVAEYSLIANFYSGLNLWERPLDD